MIIKNYYKILGVAYHATEDEIKSAYRRLAKKYHPDLNQGDADAAAKFRNVNEAGEALLDEQSRTEHDYLLESKGIHTGRFDKPEPEPLPPEAESEPESEVKEEKPKKPAPPPPKRPMTRAEKAAAAMEKVRESKKVTRRAIIIGASVAAFLILAVVIGVIIWKSGDKTYKVTFEYGNGVAANVETVAAGESVSEPPVPTWADHEFLGWYTDSALTVPATFPLKPTADITLYAHWDEVVKQEMQVTLKFADGRADEVITVYAGSWDWRGTGMETLSPPVRTGYVFDGWYALDRVSEPSAFMIPPGPLADMQKAWSVDIPYITAKWTPVRIMITLTWNDGKGSNLSQVAYGEKAILGFPAIGYRDGFIGWYDDAKGIWITDANGVMLVPSEYTQNITLTARYE